jgi:hypothetical protein
MVFYAVPASAAAHADWSTSAVLRNGTNQRLKRKWWAVPSSTTLRSSIVRFARMSTLVIFKKIT